MIICFWQSSSKYAKTRGHLHGVCHHYQGQFVQTWVKITRVSAKFECRYESLKRTFSLIILAYNLLIECSKKSWGKSILGNAFEQTKKEPEIKFNPGLVLIGLWTTGSRSVISIFLSCCFKSPFYNLYTVMMQSVHCVCLLVKAETHKGLKRVTLICLLCPMLVIIHFRKYHIWNV